MLTPTLLFILGFYLVSMVAFVINLRKAPRGYEDHQGFHFGLAPAKVILARRRPASAAPAIHNF